MLRTLGGLQESTNKMAAKNIWFGYLNKIIHATNYTIALFFILTFIVSKMMGKIKHFMSYKTFVVQFGKFMAAFCE